MEVLFVEFSVNHPILYLLVGLLVAVVLGQSVFFLVKALRRSKQIGMDQSKIKKTIKTAAFFTIAPAVSIVISVITLSKSLGLPLPWLRLSVVGSLSYEAIAASNAVSAMGLTLGKIENLTARYGSIEALHSISLEVGAGEMVALIGANGAGKTTLLNSISGTVNTGGSITFEGKEILRMKAAKIALMGLLQVPEGRHVFPGLTVEENLLVGTVASKGLRLSPGDNSQEMEMVFDLFPRLKERRKQLAWSMSGGEQQMLAIGRALMGKPKLLMLDEPSMGLAPIVIEELFEKIVEINKTGVPILMVEQNARLALKVSNRAYILDRGTITAEGSSRELLKDPKVREAYLGKAVAKTE